MNIAFYCSEKVLSGIVFCSYCLKGEFSNYEDVKFHFDFDCKNICVLETCNCTKCQPLTYLKKKNYQDVFLNQTNALSYYTEGPLKFWGFKEATLIVRLRDRSLLGINPNSGVTPG